MASNKKSNKMKGSNKAILVVVLALIILFGVGQFFAGSTPSQVNSSPTSTASSTPTTPSAPATQVVAYVPPQPASSTPVKQGSCWTNSIAAPFRADAWRCTVKNSISDPCFQIPNSSNLLCGINPTIENSTSTFVLKLTQALPAAEPVQGVPPSNWAWLVQLSDGTLCTPFTGTLPFTATGQSANYGCAPGALGDDLLIFGDLDNSSTVWTANIGTLSESTSSLPTIAASSTVSVATIWQ
jgi:hypothetical protein